MWNNFFVLTFPKVGRFSFYTRKAFYSWLVHQPELQVEVCLNI